MAARRAPAAGVLSLDHWETIAERLVMTYGFIGCGKMATALVRGAVDSAAIPRESIIVTDCDPAAAGRLSESAGVRSAPDNQALVATANYLVLCVKPGDALSALRSLSHRLEGKTLISIVAGVPIAALQEAAGPECRIVRVMPNTPSLVRLGATAYALGLHAGGPDGAATERLFGGVGEVFVVKEELLDAVTGLSGSGPAYIFLIIEALADGGVLMGLPRALALRLAAGTVAGAAAMVLNGKEHPVVLREAVTSPGGTTAAGLEALEQGGLRAALLAGVRAATERSRELGRR